MSTSASTNLGPGRQGAYKRIPQPATRIRFLMKQAVTAGLDLLFPPHCVHCDRIGSLLCPRCEATLTAARARTLPGLAGIRVVADFEGAVSSAIHALKYKKQPRLAEPLGKLLCRALREVDWPIDLVTAVPLHPTRLRERGYNQAMLLASVVARTMDWMLAADVVERVRDTPSQVHLKAEERRVNVAGAFCADAARVAGRHILIVDDVLTTGATLSACAEALYAAGAASVYGVTVAGAVFSGDPHTGVPDAPV